MKKFVTLVNLDIFNLSYLIVSATLLIKAKTPHAQNYQNIFSILCNSLPGFDAKPNSAFAGHIAKNAVVC